MTKHKFYYLALVLLNAVFLLFSALWFVAMRDFEKRNAEMNEMSNPVDMLDLERGWDSLVANLPQYNLLGEAYQHFALGDGMIGLINGLCWMMAMKCAVCSAAKKPGRTRSMMVGAMRIILCASNFILAILVMIPVTLIGFRNPLLSVELRMLFNDLPALAWGLGVPLALNGLCWMREVIRWFTQRDKLPC